MATERMRTTTLLLENGGFPTPRRTASRWVLPFVTLPLRSIPGPRATAAVALYQAGVPRLPLVLVALPAALVTFDHAFPFGSLTFGTFFVIAAWLELASGRLAIARQPRRVS